MFYSQFILAKKGPLGTIWIAAHLERKLRKNQVADTDIGVSVDSILCPEVPIALRLSSHLLLGVVRIYSRKVNYLFDDCSEALLKVKQAFRSAAVDLPPEQSKAPYHSITLPETFDLDDFELPDNEIFQGNDRHVSTREQITLQDTISGATFGNSQFGPDERFGDGDASQIGLDLEEDMFMEKENAAGTSVILNSADAEQSPAKDVTVFKDNERVPDLPLDSSASYFSIQAPSTPGLMEEPNLSSVQEGLASDDHMDEDHNIPDMVAKEISGTASSQAVASGMLNNEFNSNGKFHLLNEQENEQVKAERSIFHDDNAQSLESIDRVEAANSVDNLEILQNGEAGLNRSVDATSIEVHDHGTFADGGKAEFNGQDVISFEESETVVGNNGYQCQKLIQACQDLKNPEKSNNGSGESTVFCTPVLKPCNNSHIDSNCGTEKLPDASAISVEEDGVCSLGLSSKQDATNVVEIQAAVTNNLDESLVNDSLGVDHLENENNSKVSEFSAPEKLLSMPNMAADQSDSVPVECTPGVDFVAGDGDASFGNLLSGKKRSYTESTLTIQSLNSAASSGAAQSKHSTELVPKDDDLLSSILGGRSTTFKMKPTPPVTESSPAKRQRTSMRPSAQKRKVLMDESMVLHGDMIREQLINTEDIRRVRQKAPCTHLEVWVFQRQFLEGDIFSEPLFSGMLPEFRCLHDQAYDLSGIKIVHDVGSKAKNETNNKGAAQEHDREDVLDALQKELETFDNEVAKQMSKHNEIVKKPETQNGDEVDGEGDKLVAEALVSADVDLSHQSVNQDSHVELTSEDFSEMEQVSGSSRQNQEEIDVNVDGKSDGKSSLDETDGGFSADKVVTDSVDLEGKASPTVDRIMEKCTPMGEQRFEAEEAMASEIRHDDSCPVSNIFLDLERQASPASDKIVEECPMDELRFENEEEGIVSDIRHDDNFPTSNTFFEEDKKSDTSHLMETGLSSHNPSMNEKEDLQYLETEPMVTTEVNADHSEFGTEFFEHDTAFLNVDDDDVDEDYEDDVPNPEEKRMLDNSGWSSRTRSVANYLQVLFVKDTPHAKKVIPLESLLAGKTRKEASRMFFETLVLKTKDYIDTAQDGSFSDIKIKPTGKLMKSEF